MELRLERLWPKETYTIGRLYINNEFFCNTLEDRIVDKNKNGIFDNGEKKVYGESAIPYGTYNIIYNWSPKFGRNLPRFPILKVFSYIVATPPQTVPVAF